MITYVNTVLVANKGNQLAQYVAGSATLSNVQGDAGKIAFMNLDLLNATANGTDSSKVDYAAVYSVPTSGIVKKFKLGVVTDKCVTKVVNGANFYVPVVKWSNEIHTADIKNIAKLTFPASGVDHVEDQVTIDFSKNFDWVSDNSLAARGGFPIILRLTFKDMPTRYRNWSESYDYFVNPGDDAEDVATNFAKIINSQPRRARVTATTAVGDGALSSKYVKLILTALPYDDNDSADSENMNAKVRFNANVWYSDPFAPGFASSNKYGLGEITKTNGWEYAASAKNVRDHERTAQGYQGILNRTEWYDAKPTMLVNMDAKYGAITLEFENMYRAADDIFRKTKQTVEIYATDSTNSNAAVAPTAIGGAINTSYNLVTLIEGWVEKLATVNSANNSSSYATTPDKLYVAS